MLPLTGLSQQANPALTSPIKATGGGSWLTNSRQCPGGIFVVQRKNALPFERKSCYRFGGKKVAIAKGAVQTSSVGYELDGQRGESCSKLYNEAIQALVKRHPNRFVGIATVPLQDPPRAARVLEHAIRDLKLSGVTIASNVVGKYYDSKDFDPFWKKAEELDVLMIMHPECVAGSDKMDGYGLRTVG